MDTQFDYKTFVNEKSIDPSMSSQIKDIKTSKEAIIEFPKLELLCINTKNEKEMNKIEITPNSINGEIRNTNKFIISKDDIKNNDLKDKLMGNKQFEMGYDKFINKFNIIDTKMGTGLFIRIQKLQIKQDTIVSFCQTHMIVQLDISSI
jgi:hypothetical protein